MTAQDDQEFDEFDNLVDEAAGEDFADAAPVKKKSSTGLIAILLLVVGAVGAAVWFLFLNPSAPSEEVPPAPIAEAPAPNADPNALPPGVVSPDQQAAVPAPSDAPQDSSVAPPTPSEDQLQLATDQGAAPAAPDAATPPAPVDGTVAEALPPPTDGTVAPPVPAEGSVPVAQAEEQPAPTADQPVADQASAGDIQAALPTPTVPEVSPEAAPAMPAPTQEAPTPVAQEAQPVPATETTTPVAETPAVPVQAAADPATIERLGQLESQLQNLTQDISALRNAPAPTAAQATVDPQLGNKIDSLTEKLEQLTKQVDALDTRTTTLATELQNRPTASERKASEPSAIEPVAQHEEPVAKPAPKKAAPKKAAAKPSAPKTSSGGGWELRGAQPGVAWLGRLGSGEMTRYAVGQEVPGLGTVKAVTQEGGRWTVETTGGTIRQ